jgi:hypothetical protein
VERPAQYEKTLFDRHGADAADMLKAWAYGLAVFGVVFAGTMLFFAMSGSKPSVAQWLLAIGLGCLLAAATGYAGLSLARAAGKGWKQLMVDGSTTPYEEQYSHEQSLVMRGHIDDALASFEAILQGNPDAVKPRIRAAELHSRETGNHVRAAQLLAEVQRIESTGVGDYVYATHRLVDLYTGPLNEPGRAMVELRRLIERLPGTAAADHAREALATLKARYSVSG